MHAIQTSKAPAALGPYSQGIVLPQSGLVFISGQLGLDPVNSVLRDGIKEQTRQALANLFAIIGESGSSDVHVVKTTVFLKDLGDFQAMNEVYAEFFKDRPPARSAVQVSRLPKDALIEIEAIAILGD